MRSIKTKIIISVEALVLVIILLLSIISIKLSTDALDAANSKTMIELAKQGTQTVRSKLDDQLHIIELLASRENIKDANITPEEKLSSLNDDIKKYGYMKMAITDLKGNILYSNGKTDNIARRQYFKEAKEGKVAVSDPVMSGTEHVPVVVYMAPIYSNGKIISFLSATKDGNDISSISDNISFGKTGKAFMILKNGVKVAHYNKDLVLNEDNDFDNVNNDPSLKRLVDLENKMANGEEGSGTYDYGGKEKFLCFAPVEGTQWSLAVCADNSEIMEKVSHLKILILLFSCVFTILSILITYLIVRKLVNSINIATNLIIPMASGDFTKSVPEKFLENDDEVGQMVNAADKMQKSLKKMLNIVIEKSSILNANSKKLLDASTEMNFSAESVATAIDEVTKGAVSQTNDLGNIRNLFNDFSNDIEKISNSITEVDQSAKNIKVLSKNSNKQMKILSDSANRTSDSFRVLVDVAKSSSETIEKVNNIIGVIESVAEQTNLLALNASIESARAGEAGKGFAVVAEEIRKLSEQSKSSSDNIINLINDILKQNEEMMNVTKKVSTDYRNQADQIEETIKAFDIITDAINYIIPMIMSVNTSTADINNKKDEIEESIESTSAVSEENSAASEEISASSGELKKVTDVISSAANELKESADEMLRNVKNFKL